MKRAMITGATGAVGSALVNELIKNNIEVLVICRENSNRNGNIPDSPLVSKIYCDLKRLSSLNNTTGKEYDVFYHFAWMGTIGNDRNNMYLQNLNIQYSLDAVGVAKRFGCRLFIGAGSQAEYGRVDGKLRSDTPTFPENGYGYAKLCAGQMTRDYAHQLGMGHIWTRILSIYGPNDNPQSMVMSTIHKLLDGEVPKFTKGEQRWDYLYSGDAARALLLLGERGNDGKTYVLGSGTVRPLSEYIIDIQRIVNPECKIRLGAIPYGEKQVMFLCADTYDLKNDTGWSPVVCFEDGIKNILELM